MKWSDICVWNKLISKICRINIFGVLLSANLLLGYAKGLFEYHAARENENI